MTAAREGNVPAETLAILLAEHERFARFLRRRLRSSADAEDVLQTAYTNALTRGAGPGDRTRAVTWFFRVLRRALIDHLRREEAGRRRLARRGASPTLSAGDEAALRSAACDCVSALLGSLRPDQADLLRRVELDGDSVSSVARSLGAATGAVAVRVHRARKALAQRLRGVCGACSTHGCARCTCRHGGGSPPV